jgi:hypothetical protein
MAGLFRDLRGVAWLRGCVRQRRRRALFDIPFGQSPERKKFAAEQPRGYAVSPLAGAEKSCHPTLLRHPVRPLFLIRHTAMPSHYDIIIIGTGPGGDLLAK